MSRLPFLVLAVTAVLALAVGPACDSKKSDAPSEKSAEAAKPTAAGEAESHAKPAESKEPAAAEEAVAPEKAKEAEEEKGPKPPTKEQVAERIKPPENLKEAPKDAEKHAKGLRSKVLKKGTGTVHPTPADAALVHYSVFREDGKLLDSSWKRGEPRLFRVDGQMAGWKQGLQLMVEGERRVVWIPEKLAYRGRPGKPRGTITFDAELIELRRCPDAPVDVAKPPKDATKTKSGLYWKELEAGKGEAQPGRFSTVMVNYAGWTTDGKCFDSTALTDQPAMFGLTDVIEGWTEGIQLMKEGGKTRFWIPKNLAYKGKKGKPKGMLVFDVELLQFSKP